MRHTRSFLVTYFLPIAVLAACAEGTAAIGSDGDEEEEEVGAAGPGGGAGVGGAGVGGAHGPASSSSGEGPSSASATSSGSSASSSSASGSTTSSSSSSSVASSSSSGGQGCDSSATCDDCQLCAFNSPADCQAEADACLANLDCLDLNDCLSFCTPNDTFCIDDCANAYPNGIDDLVALGDCVFCQACYVTCDGATNC